MADLGSESSVARDFNRDGVLFIVSVWQMWEPIETMKCCLLPFPQLFLWDQLFKLDTFQSEEASINLLQGESYIPDCPRQTQIVVTCIQVLKQLYLDPPLPQKT